MGGTETKREFPERGDARDTTVTRALSVITGSEEGSALALGSREGNDRFEWREIKNKAVTGGGDRKYSASGPK